MFSPEALSALAAARTVTCQQQDIILQLLEKDDNWAEHAGFPLEEWKYEVRNDDTRLGYWPWVVNKLLGQQENPEQETADDEVD